MDRYVLNMIFLSIFVSAIVISFRHTFENLIEKTDKYKIIALGILSLIIHGAISYFILTFLDQPVFPFDSRGTSFLLMNNFFLLAKPLEILVQQLLIILLVTKLKEQGMSLRRIITLFVLFFGTIHIFQIFKTDLIIGLGFTFFAILASFIFPYLVLKVRNGYIYNFMIHLVAYDIAALFVRLLY